MTNQPQGSMHPDDKRNLIVFFVLCVVAFFAYDHFVQKPKVAALKAQQQAAAIAATQNPATAEATNLSPLTRDEALKGGARVAIDNPDLSGSLNLKGARIDDLSLRQYFETIENKTPVTLLSPARTEHPLYLDFGWLNDGTSAVKVPNNDSVWHVKSGSTLSKDSPVTLSWSNGQGLTFERTYALDDAYMFTVTQTVTNATNTPVTLHAYASVSRQGLPADYVKNAVMHEGPIGYFDGHLKEVSYKDFDKKPRQDFPASAGWTGFTDKYWFSGIIPAKEESRNFRFIKAGDEAKPVYQIDMTGAPLVVPAKGEATETTYAFVGPKKLEQLNKYADDLKIKRFDLVIDFGKFWFLTIPFFHILTWLGHTIGSFAIAILVFTVLLRGAVFPLANKSYRSFARMRKIQPKMLEIREKYGDDRARLQKEIFDLYKKEQVNPMAGCLPLLVQIPIFFSLYKVLYITLEMRHAPFFGWIHDMSAPDPLSVFTLFGLLPWDLPAALTIGVWPIIMGFTLYIQQRLNPPAQDPVQARVLSFMPIFITYLMAHFPAGLVIYWSWSNCLSILQQYVLMRREGVDVSFFKRSKIDKQMQEAVAHGPSVHPAAEEIKHDLDVIEHIGDTEPNKPITPPDRSKKKGR